MKLKIHLIFTMSLCLATLGFTSCENDEPQLPVQEKIVPEEEPKVEEPKVEEPKSEEPQSRGAIPIPLEGKQSAINDKLNDFAWRLFSEAYAQKTEPANILLSPLSLEIALAMFQNGLVPEDQLKMLKTMGLEDYTADEVNAYFKTMVEGIVEADDLATLEIANALWYQDDYKINADFQQALEDGFDAKVQDAPFDNTTIDAINQWCAEKTHDLITKLFESPKDVDVFALLNAVYFKAGWEIPFKKEYTEERPFYFADGTMKNIPMMLKHPGREEISDRFNYLENDNFQALALPFINKAFLWFAILPKEDKSIAETLPLIKAETLDDLANSKDRLTQIIIPKYEINYSVNNLVNIIDALNPDLHFKYLNFQSAFETPLPADMEITALQKTCFKIDEEGAEAAAVTGISALTSVPPSITFDHPFIYGLMETSSKCPLFIGYYGDKTE
ncbi:MAG: hypothetical protein IJ845_01480 [Bacteroidaceae bacterium]|nr:hypothetical protein [Bacteroidaceae bacterium]